MPKSNLTLEERFWIKVNKTETCWLWTAFLDNKGYGKFQVGKQSQRAHRFSYELLVEPIPQGLQIDHLCKIRNCVNPAHLEAVTLQENVRRSSVGSNFRDRTHCANGHEYTAENTVRRAGVHGRQCKTCDRAKTNRYQAKKNGTPIRPLSETGRPGRSVLN